MFELLYDNAKENNSEVVVAYNKTHTREELSFIKMGATGRKNRTMILDTPEKKAEFLEQDINGAAWNKLYNREWMLKNKIAFTEHSNYEDIVFSVIVKASVKKVSWTENYVYHHIDREDSESMSTANWKRKVDYIINTQRAIEELKERNLFDEFYDHYAKSYFVSYLSFFRSFMNMYTYMPVDIWNSINNTVRIQFPDYQKIPLVEMILNDESHPDLTGILYGLSGKVSDAYIEEIGKMVREEAAKCQ